MYLQEQMEEWKIGWKEGWKEGRDEQAQETAVNLYRLGMDVQLIAKATGYSENIVSGWVLKN